MPFIRHAKLETPFECVLPCYSDWGEKLLYVKCLKLNYVPLKERIKSMNGQINERKWEQMPLNIMYKKLVKFFKETSCTERMQGGNLKKARQGKISSDSQRFSSSTSQRYRKKDWDPHSWPDWDQVPLLGQLTVGQSDTEFCQDVNKTVEQVRLNSC